MHWVAVGRPLFHEAADLGWKPSSTLTFPVYQAVSQITNDYREVGLKLFPWKQNCGAAFQDTQKKRQLLFKCLCLEMCPPKSPIPHPPIPCLYLAGSCHDLTRCRATRHFYRSLSSSCHFLPFTWDHGASQTHLRASRISTAQIYRSSRHAFYKAFIERVKQEIGAQICPCETLLVPETYIEYLSPDIWCGNSTVFTKTETIMQLQSLVKLPEQLFGSLSALSYEKQTLLYL